MYRNAIEYLHKWKTDKYKKPLIIKGARQVGKTWLMKEFGSQAYERCIYINFDSNDQIKALFLPNLDITRLITGIELYAGYKIDPDTTLIIFDEVQECPKALTSLKYFNENANQYHIICAGSLLGIALHPGTSFPVGKVDFMELFPLSFSEFLKAMDEERFVSLLEQGDFDMVKVFKQNYTDLLKHYYYIGGMPEAVLTFSESRDFNAVRTVQERILAAYEQDFSKHAPNEIVPKIRMIWNSIPAQLTKENKKFIYGLVKESARAREYERALMWLCDCGLVHKVHRVSTPKLPLKAYEDLKIFKLFALDVGLLSCMTRLRQEVLISGNELFKEFKGALTEQYVFQQLKATGIQPYYWANNRNTSEIDFILDTGGKIIPLEVKAEVNLQSKSLRAYAERFNPTVSIRTAMTDFKEEGWLVNLPLYAIEYIQSY